MLIIRSEPKTFRAAISPQTSSHATRKDLFDLADRRAWYNNVR